LPIVIATTLFAIERVKEILVSAKSADASVVTKIKEALAGLKKAGIDLSKPETREDAEKIIETLAEFE
jgi:hypothetical protein